MRGDKKSGACAHLPPPSGSRADPARVSPWLISHSILRPEAPPLAESCDFEQS